MVGRRRKHSEERLEERLEEDAERAEERGILELFPTEERDEDAPLARDGDDDDSG